MNKSKNIGLFVLLIFQSALIVYLYQTGHNTAPPAAALFNGLTADSLSALTITDDNAKSVHLTKTAGHWTVGSNGFPADDGKIKTIIKRFSELRNSRLVARSKGSHSRLKVSEQLFNRKVTMTSDGKDITFFLGTSPSSKSIHLRRADEDNVYEVSGLSAWQLQADNESWWQSKYIAVNPADLKEFTITYDQAQQVKGRKNISLSRDSKGAWQLTAAPTGSKLDDKQINKILETISEITITGYKAKDFAPTGKAVATITYKTADKSFNLQIWAKKDEKASTQIIKNSDSKFYASVSSYILKDILELQYDSLIQK